MVIHLEDIANILRRDSLIMTTKAGSGHPSSCLSCAEILSCLFFDEMHFDPLNPKDPDNDEFILSKGHAAPILYSSLFRAGCIKDNLLDLRKISSRLQGHPIPHLYGWIKVATGSLGQGLSVGIGYSLAAKKRARKYKTFVLLGDSELAEGSNWEAFQLASHYNLNNLIAIIDLNGLGQTGETMFNNPEKLKKKIDSFGWNSIIINGHNIPEILASFKYASHSSKPVAIIAKTFKGKGVSFMENKNGWHGKALTERELESALLEIPNPKMPPFIIKKPISLITKEVDYFSPELTDYNKSVQVSTREAYGNSLSNLAKSNGYVMALDAEVSNSTFSEKVKSQNQEQFIQCFIAEQNMIGISLGLSVKKYNVFASTFSAFLSRAHDQIRMAAISRSNLTIAGSHSGVSIGEDGVSQMGLEDISIFRSLPNSLVFYPSDAVSTERIVNLSSRIPGIKYIRLTRPKTPIIYSKNDKFPIGEFKVLKQSEKDKLVIIGAGITLHESLKAHDLLKKKNISSSIIDLYCIKPLDSKRLINFIKSHGNKVLIAEDHYKEGGIGEMIAHELINSGIKLKHLFKNNTKSASKK